MIVQVKKDFKDKRERKKLRRKGELLSFSDTKRAKELITKGFAVEKEIVEVKGKQVKNEGKDTNADIS